MIGAAISDTHLGARRFSRTENGVNAHEMAIERAWFEAVDQIVAARVDLVTIAGDVFEHPRVDSRAVKAYRDGVRRLRESGAIVVIVSGNHDMPRSSDSTSPIVMPDDYEGVYVVTEPKVLTLYMEDGNNGTPCIQVSVAAFPFVTLADPKVYRLDLDPAADVNILVAHCSVNGDALGLPKFYGHDAPFNVREIAEKFDVVALGDYHEFTRLHPDRLAFYSGSLERVSSNLWAETQPKGWVWFDTETRQMELREVEGRKMVVTDIEDCIGSAVGVVRADADAVNVCLKQMADGQMDREIVTDALVRFTVPDFPREERQQIDWSLVKKLKERCLHFELAISYKAASSDALPDRRAGVVTLDEQAREWFADDDEDVRAAGLGYMGVEV